MFADDQGGLADEALFVVATNPDPTLIDARAKDRARGAIHGRLSRSTLAPLVTHLALAVQWGSWHQPPERVGAENLSTSCDLGIFVDEPAESIQPHDPYIGPWNQLGDKPQG